MSDRGYTKWYNRSLVNDNENPNAQKTHWDELRDSAKKGLSPRTPRSARSAGGRSAVRSSP